MRLRHHLLVLLALLMIAAITALWWFSRPLPVLPVTTWAGPYGRAQASAQMRPYAAVKSVDVRIAQWDGDLSEVERAVKTRQYKGSVIDFELPGAVEACQRGLLEKIDPSILPAGADGTPAANDFVPGALGPCWVGSVVYSQITVFSPALNRVPQTLADFFDTRKIRGRRALIRGTAKFNLEMALLADGVAPANVYRTLETPEGLDHAFNKLAALHPIWAHDGADALRWVQNGQAVMAAALNGDVYDAAQKGFTPSILWDRQLYELDVWGIPVGNPNRKRALDFIAFATGSAPLAGVAGWVPYGPARRSSLPLVKNNPDLGIAMKPWLPTAHFDRAFLIDDAWWLAHEAQIAPRWQAFVSQ